jgi:hypothetical protein
MSINKRILENPMKNLRSLLVLSLTIACFLLVANMAMADPLNITFTNGYQYGVGGETLTFDVSLINNSPTEVVNLNSDSMNINPANLVVNDEFLANAPFSMDPESETLYEAFTVFIPNGTPLGVYDGQYQILGGATDSDFGEVGTGTFDVEVTGSVVPEPSSLVLLMTGLAGLGAALCRRPIQQRYSEAPLPGILSRRS